MTHTARRTLRLAVPALAAAAAIVVATAARAGALTIANEPLGTATSSIKPNVMFILDTSGSMGWDYMPDYVPDRYSPSASTASCFDVGDDSSGTITGNPDPCQVGDPPYMSPDLNTIYYNPSIYYRPAVNYDGTAMPIQNAANTADWTSVRTDMYNVQNIDQLGANVDYVNLAYDYPDRVWCKDPSDSVSDCLQNSAYTYPNDPYSYGEDGSGNIRYISSAPYYYRFRTAQYCEKDGSGNLVNCKSGSAIDPAVEIYPAIEYCTDPELTDCAAGAAVTSAHIYSGVRWCKDEDTLQNCQRKKIGSYIYPKHIGTTKNITGTWAATYNTGTITVNSVIAAGGRIDSVKIDGVPVLSGPITFASGTAPGTVAAALASAINGYTSSPNYTASATGTTVNITKAVAGAAGNGARIVVLGSFSAASRATSNIEISTVSSSPTRTIDTVAVDGNNLLCSTATAGGTTNFNNSVTVLSNGNIQASSGWNSNSERDSVLSAIAARVNACSTANGGYTASADLSNNWVTLTAPLSLGALANGYSVEVSGTSVRGVTTHIMAGGSSSFDIQTSATRMTGGMDAFSGTRTFRLGVGAFTRTDIVSDVDSYPKAAARIDCLGTSCTYAEEMTNFANWYTYYRTRIKMMKTAAGRAFMPVGQTYRVGFITINPGSPVSSSRYLKVDDFTTGAGGHKEDWYAKFYSQSTVSSTPLREALSRVGWLFAGKFNTGLTSGIASADDPMTMSCQPNFAILSTDGYWNGSAGEKLDGTSIGNQDNVDSGWSKRADGAYDGNLSGASSTLADVAMYYYKTDLRTTGSFATNNVPITNKDGASHQHMTTFTLGLGLDGELSYRPDYESASKGDFWSIKQGTKNWPVPVADAPSALDDLWHAAVNARGVFFSARDPATLATNLTETLDALKTRVGAGAAAATSNLQPVAGDNFAFTAQYQTVAWIGDLKARTIDLTSGIVSKVTLWSGAAKLDEMTYTDRYILTYDSDDTAGNLLKNFCWPADPSTNCADGGGPTGGLTLAEQAYFDPVLLAQYPYGADPGKLATVSAQKLVEYIRGNTDYEDTGLGAPTDLFRQRLSLLGDIINAQPAYVKKSPFGYIDNGYAEFKACTSGTGTSCPAAQFPFPNESRRGTVYAASNDGMLHAFETDVNNDPYYQTAGIATDITADDTFQGRPEGNGVERWAYIPRIVMPEIYQLANEPYGHVYSVDGSPSVGDICKSAPCAGLSDWRTILVAGLNSGGAGYYALDITNPLKDGVRGLWEFTRGATCWTDDEIKLGGKYSDCNVGLSYGNPIITKIKAHTRLPGYRSWPNDTWVVLVTSGYNNNVGGGDGRGYLYVLDAFTGEILDRMTTGVGTVAAPSGFGRINGWTSGGSTNNTTVTVYGGDLEGNLWRFNLDSTQPVYGQAVLFTTVTDAGGTRQPITVRPELGEADGQRVIMFGTGLFLQNVDKTTTDKQSIYALRDDTAIAVGPVVVTPRSNAGVKKLSFTPDPGNNDNRSLTPTTAPNWATELGWMIDLPDSGERVNVDPQLQLGTLVVVSNVPSLDTCTAGGYSFINNFDFKKGTYVTANDNTTASIKIASSLTVGINVIMLPGGAVQTIVTTADNQQLTTDTPVTAAAFGGRRVSWRELFKE